MFRSKQYDYPLIVIGAGAGGLVIALGAAKAGKKVLMIEAGNYGGDCTNFGCIPSKALIEAAHFAHAVKQAQEFGIALSLASFDAKGVLDRTRRIISSVKKEEDQAALKEHQIDTLTGFASFEDPHSLKVTLTDGGIKWVSGKQIVIATGSRPKIPKVAGIHTVPYYTNETIFDLQEIPETLAVLGGGPIGCELGQAFQRLGSQVILIQKHPNLLTKEELEASALVEQALKKEGVQLHLGMHPAKAEMRNGKIALLCESNAMGESAPIEATHLLIAAGRVPNIAKLRLESAHVNYNRFGVMVDAYGRSSQKHIWAVGDVAGHALFTHIAKNEARTVLWNILSPYPFLKKEDNYQSIPRVTFTDPELASFGLSEQAAREQYGHAQITVHTIPFTDVDRAITASRTEGFVKVIAKKWSGKVLGATIVGPRAGEMITELTLAKHSHVPLRKIATLIHPYPTYNQGVRKAAEQWLTQTLKPFIPQFFGWQD